jgi:hypothetical protein
MVSPARLKRLNVEPLKASASRAYRIGNTVFKR